MNCINFAIGTGVKTEVLSLAEVYRNKLLFKIPAYQRPYVWSVDDVLKIFDDIKNAHERKEAHYFLGTTITSRVKGDDVSMLELVDGQQRTTTLMLICMAFKYAGKKCELSDVSVYKDDEKDTCTPRLKFEIRPHVQQLFSAEAVFADAQSLSTENVENDVYLKGISTALNALIKEVKVLKQDEMDFYISLSRYIYSNVQWVNNIVPPNTDLNRLFATMNTSGVQLEQSDILKAKLLKHISPADKPRYEAMWSACENMDNYFESSVKQLFSVGNWQTIGPEDFASSNKFLLKHPKEELVGESGVQTIDSLWRTITAVGSAEHDDADTSDFSKEMAVDGSSESDESIVKCRSIINFPLLLIHAYRIFLINTGSDIEKPVDSRHLLEIFEPLSSGGEIAANSLEDEVKKFFETLWKVRYAFDRWIVKWVENGETEQHLGLTNLSYSDEGTNRYFNRSERSVDDMLMLQSVRYFTGDRSAQYWLTPFLARLIRGDVPRTDKAELLVLEEIDNQLSLATTTLKEASFVLARGAGVKTCSWSEQEKYFREPKGTRFGHYWFQKLEYLLWKQLILDGKSDSNQYKRLKNYRITSKNSVEHVHPQNEEHGGTLEDEYLNSFGNLVLLSPAENSSYSNQDVGKKKIDFDKRDLTSLKLLKLFQLAGVPVVWNAERIIQHRDEMIGVLRRHYQDG